MGLVIGLGNGGNANATVIDSTFLNAAPISESTLPSGPTVEAGEVPVATVNVPGAGKGGVVEISYDGDTNAFVFDTTWNGVKDLKATSDQAENVKVIDFVHVDVDFSKTASGGAVTGNSSVEIDNLKRGNVVTGAGDDTIKISLSTNDAGWQNTVNINSGAGNDTIVISAGQKSGAAGVLDGSLTTVTIDAGAGTDTIDLSGVSLKAATVTGGAGNDTIYASGGADTFVYGATSNGNDYIYGFNASQDKLQLASGVTALYTPEVTEDGVGTVATLFNAGKVVGTVHFVDTILVA